MAIILFLLRIKWAQNLVKSKPNKREFHRSKQRIYLNQVEISKMVISDKFRFDDGVKNFIGYKMITLLNHYVLFYLRRVDLLNILKTMLFLADDDDDDDAILK